MKNLKTFLMLVVCVLAINFGIAPTAGAISIYNEVTDGDLLDHAWPHSFLGPSGLGDSTSFGSGTWSATGSVHQNGGDDNDYFNFTTSGVFDLHVVTGPTDFVGVNNAHDSWNSGGVYGPWPLPGETSRNFTVTGLAAGDYSFGITSNGGVANWSWDITVSGGGAPGAGAVPEPTTMLLLGMGLIGFAGTRRRMKK